MLNENGRSPNSTRSTTTFQAIDVHGHYGTYVRGSSSDAFHSADAAEVVRRASEVHIGLTLVSPLSALLPRLEADAIEGNDEANSIVSNTPNLKQYVVIDPINQATYLQAETMLPQPHCVGIKIHPEEHGYPIGEFAREIFEFAAEYRAVILTHSSEQNSLAQDFVAWANEFPEVKLILAHIGCGWDGDHAHQVRAIQQCRHGNVFADTSSARSIMPGLIEWAVREIGADRVLFGTDTPLYHTAMQRARIDNADLTVEEKQLILRYNAEKLFNLSLSVPASA